MHETLGIGHPKLTSLIKVSTNPFCVGPLVVLTSYKERTSTLTFGDLKI